MWPARKLYVIGVTGTDGKTTTCTLIYEILKKAGIRAGLLTTVGAKIGNEDIDTGFHTTNPGPELLQPLLQRAVKNGITHMVLEVTSHGLDQNRVVGCNFKIGVLTNVTHEHLDYHRTLENYRRAKLKLFNNVEYAVLNEDEENFEFYKSHITDAKIYKYKKTKLQNISPFLAGDYNRYNIGAAEMVAKILGVETFVPLAVQNFSGVPGRREEVKAGQNFRLFVDFAHTPNALEQVLIQLRKETRNKIILVFGCTGERDKTKRPMMGEIAERLADIVIVTSDDTRSENQDEIARQIMSGMKKKPIKENDRRKAIEMAVKAAKPGDIVLLAGKGHEKSILIGEKESPWSDTEEAERAISGVV
jgi:UDP-N-acetylmuramoyl-L-alanyl-D-glutamate--2,6-diaminopimelate ligase